MPLRWPELILILAVVVVIFAAGKIPEISGGLRRTVDNLRGRQPEYGVGSEPLPGAPGDDGGSASDTEIG